MVKFINDWKILTSSLCWSAFCYCGSYNVVTKSLFLPLYKTSTSLFLTWQATDWFWRSQNRPALVELCQSQIFARCPSNNLDQAQQQAPEPLWALVSSGLWVEVSKHLVSLSQDQLLNRRNKYLPLHMTKRHKICNKIRVEYTKHGKEMLLDWYKCYESQKKYTYYIGIFWKLDCFIINLCLICLVFCFSRLVIDFLISKVQISDVIFKIIFVIIIVISLMMQMKWNIFIVIILNIFLK